MHASGAAPSRAAQRQRAVLHVLLLTFLAVAALGGQGLAAPLTLVQSQQTPAVRLSAFTYRVGDTLTLSASGLETGASYVVSLRSPAGEVSEQEVPSDQGGALSVRAVVDEPGTW